MQDKLTPASLAMGVGAIITLLGSFFNFLGSGGFGFNAWSMDGFAFASTVPALLALAMLIWMGLEIGGVSLPDEVITFTQKQLKATWGIAAAGIMLSYITVDNIAAGFWIMLLGSLGMAAGSVMDLLGMGNEPLSSGTSSTDGAPMAAPQAAPPTTPPPASPPMEGAPGDNQPPPPPA